jgi:hypothetical protein
MSRIRTVISLRNSCGLEALLILSFAQVTTGQIQVSPSHPESIQKAIETAYRSGQKHISFPAGSYRVRPPSSGPHLRFEHLTDFTIDATGVELIFTDQTRGGIEFQDCRNVTLLGLRVRFEVPPFTQGVVADVSPRGDWYDVRIDPFYPVNLDNPAYFPSAPVGYLFDSATRNIRSGAFDLNEQRVERRGPNLFRFYRSLPSGPGVQPVSPGDLVAFRGSGPHNIVLINCANMRLDGVTIFNAATFAVFETGGAGGNRYRLSVTRGPRPSGARTDPLFSSTADAFHSANVRRGPVLEDCHFESMGDDGIAIHGTYSLVLQAKGNRIVVSKGTFQPGDPIRLLDTRDIPAGETTVRSVRSLEHLPDTQKSHRDTLSDNSTGPYFELTLARPFPAAFDYLVSNPAASGSGYVLRHNSISNHRARGMLLKADNGLVEGNVIDGSTMGGIVLTPEFWWGESDYSRNVIIRENTIRNVASAPGQLGGVVLAALDKKPIPACGHRSIIIENNRFENINGVNLLITSACNVIVRNNQFKHPQQKAVQAGGAEWGEDPEALVFVTETQGLKFKDNQTLSPGPFFRTLLHGPSRNLVWSGWSCLERTRGRPPFKTSSRIIMPSAITKGWRTDSSVRRRAILETQRGPTPSALGRHA